MDDKSKTGDSNRTRWHILGERKRNSDHPDWFTSDTNRIERKPPKTEKKTPTSDVKDEFHEEVNGRRIDPWIDRPLEGLRVVRPCVGLSGTSHVIKTPSFEWRRPFNTAAAAKKGNKSKSKSKRVAAKKIPRKPSWKLVHNCKNPR